VKSGPIPTFRPNSQVCSTGFPAAEAGGGSEIGSGSRSDDLHHEGEPSRLQWLRAPATIEIALTGTITKALSDDGS